MGLSVGYQDEFEPQIGGPFVVALGVIGAGGAVAWHGHQARNEPLSGLWVSLQKMGGNVGFPAKNGLRNNEITNRENGIDDTDQFSWL